MLRPGGPADGQNGAGGPRPGAGWRHLGRTGGRRPDRAAWRVAGRGGHRPGGPRAVPPGHRQPLREGRAVPASRRGRPRG
eukprot:2995054-Lingulodinium_polyedra.AAC.1